MIYCYSTNGQERGVTLRDALMQGLAADGGLFMPEVIEGLPPEVLSRLPSLSFAETSYEVAKHLLRDSVPHQVLRDMIASAMNIDVPVVPLSDDLYTLELFHGPTLSFKDFGARFMAALLGHWASHRDRELHILAATSGDTGSAIAAGFLGMPGIKVVILYPKGKVSAIQEKQLTTMGHNVMALEVDGKFDDCQALVKRAFNDQVLAKQVAMTSANSINIGRLIAQSFYYFYAYSRVDAKSRPVVFSVPSGNFGNLTGGLLAKRMGLPVERFIAATNVNDSVPKYLETGLFQPHPSIETLSNAMDVGNPSNFARILDLYDNDLQRIRADIFGASFTDEQTKLAIRELCQRYHYIADPHGAVAYLGVKEYRNHISDRSIAIFLETAHPAKFLETVQPLVDVNIQIPRPLAEAMERPKQAIAIPNDYDAFCSLFLRRAL